MVELPRHSSVRQRSTATDASHPLLAQCGVSVEWRLLGPLIPYPVWYSSLLCARSFDPEKGVVWGRVAASDGAMLHRSEGPTLLMVHGTGLRTRTGFVGLTETEFARLKSRYGGRILAWEHRALSQHLDRNARVLGRALERFGVPMDIEVMALSRGGLLMRRLIEGWEPLRDDIQLRTMVMVGTPNDGTPSARRDPMGQGNVPMKAWRTDVRRLALVDQRDREAAFHDDPFSLPGYDRGEAQLGSWPWLSGSQDQVPGSRMLQQLNGFAGPAPHARRTSTYFGLASIFNFDHGAPERELLPGMGRREVCAHAIPGVPNDLVVPTASVFRPKQGADASGFFPLCRERVVVLQPSMNATHVGLFRVDAVRRQVLQWLLGPS